MEATKPQKKNRVKDFFKRIKGNVSGGVFLTLALTSLAALLVITIFIIVESFPVFTQVGFFRFLFGLQWAPERGLFGVFPMIIGTVTVTLCAILIGVPIGLCCAIFMSEFAPKKVRNGFRPAIQMLAGIPSVVYGYVGLKSIVPFILKYIGGPGLSMLAGSLILAIMILPTVISISEVALSSLPRQYKDGALALGMTHWQSIRRVQVPAAKSGILASIILGVGRAVGETMAVILVLGNAPALPQSILDPIRTLTTNIGLEFSYAEGTHRNALFATGLVLFAIIMIVNSIAQNLIRERVRGGAKKNKLSLIDKIKALFTKKPAAPAPRPIARVVPFTKTLTAKIPTPPEAAVVAKIPTPPEAEAEPDTVHENIPPDSNSSQPESPASVNTDKPAELTVKKRLISPRTTARIAKGVIWAAAMLVMAILVSILVYLLVKGLPQLSWSFFKGIAPTVVGTLFVTFIAVLIAIPLGVGAAFFLAEYTKQNVFTRIIRFSIESLAGIPSIVYGLFGFTFFVINLGMRYSVLAGGLTLAIMILPTIIRTTEEAIKAVPNSLRETSYSLGATKWQTIRKVVFPSAMSGIVNGIILSIGRCVAETAAIMLTLGVVLKTPASLFDSGRTMASHFYLLVMENPDDVSAFGVAVLLIFSILLINIVANTLVNRFVSKNERRSKKFKKGGGYAAKSTLAAKD